MGSRLLLPRSIDGLGHQSGLVLPIFLFTNLLQIISTELMKRLVYATGLTCNVVGKRPRYACF
jgi:hypothetical protein